MPGALSKGMCNFPINMTEDERAVWGRLAFEKDVPLGQLLRQMALDGLKSAAPDKAELIQEIRHSRRMMKSVFMLAIGLFSIGVSLIENDDLRRAPRSNVRVVRSVRINGRKSEIEG